MVLSQTPATGKEGQELWWWSAKSWDRCYSSALLLRCHIRAHCLISIGLWWGLISWSKCSQFSSESTQGFAISLSISITLKHIHIYTYIFGSWPGIQLSLLWFLLVSPGLCHNPSKPFAHFFTGFQISFLGHQIRKQMLLSFCNYYRLSFSKPPCSVQME